MALEDNTKKVLAEMVRNLEAKLKELKPVENQLKVETLELKQPGIGLHKDDKGKYHLVKISFDVEKKAAAISEVVNLNSTDPAIALYNLNKYVAETIVRKTRGGKYDK